MAIAGYPKCTPPAPAGRAAASGCPDGGPQGNFGAGDSESVDAARRAARSLRRRLLHAGQARVDALDRSVRLVDVHLDDEFKIIVVGHLQQPLIT